MLAEKLVEKHDSTCFIVSSDKDFLQLVTDKIIVYRPMEKEYYTPKVVKKNLD
jgi:5'-3' exonuclease